jgi:hypothetical protein
MSIDIDPGDALSQSIVTMRNSLEVGFAVWGVAPFLAPGGANSGTGATPLLIPPLFSQVTQKSTGDILSILEKVDTRLSSLEQNMGPIRRVRSCVRDRSAPP